MAEIKWICSLNFVSGNEKGSIARLKSYKMVHDHTVWFMTTPFGLTKLLSFDSFILKLWTPLTSGVGLVRVLFPPALHLWEDNYLYMAKLNSSLHKSEARIR